MKYIKVYTASNANILQSDIQQYQNEKKHNIIDQSCSVAYDRSGSFSSDERYIVTVTYDDGQGS